MKERLDVILTNLGLAPSRERAKALIMEGLVYVNGQKEDKPGAQFDLYQPVEVRGNDIPYVSRGGLKLEKAMKTWSVPLDGMTCMDVGASTGGFTDCMLQNGAKKVYAVDVGYGQLAWKLRNDDRVVNLEKTNIRYITEAEIPEKIDFVSIDVSFISLSKVLPPVKERMAERGRIVCLVKPQFEAGREKVGKKGVVREKETHIEVCENILKEVLLLGFSVLGMTFSPIRGPEGNIEYLLYLQNTPTEEELSAALPSVKDIVSESHEQTEKK